MCVQTDLVTLIDDEEDGLPAQPTVIDGRLLKQNSVIAEVEIAGAVIGIHSGGEGKRTWTGISLQVVDVIVGARAVAAAGGSLAKEPEPENGEPPHLAMCADPDGNEFMLTRKRG